MCAQQDFYLEIYVSFSNVLSVLESSRKFQRISIKKLRKRQCEAIKDIITKFPDFYPHLFIASDTNQKISDVKR